MKNFMLLLCLLLSVSLANAQTTIDAWGEFYFGDLQGWTNTDGGTELLTSETFPPDPTGYMMQKICDGSTSAVGEMAVVKIQDEPGSVNICGGIDCFAGFEFHLNNINSFDIHLVVGFKDVNGNRVTYPDNTIVVPALSDFWYYSFGFAPPYYVDGTFDFTQITEVKVFHSLDATSYDGEILEGTLQIEAIYPILLLGTEDNMLQTATLSPNPASDRVAIEAMTQLSSYRMYDLSGKLVNEGTINDLTYVIDLSHFKSGMYFVEITFDMGKEVHRIVRE
ncbi:T9SS type A sorting domain-containing protein [Aureisphaera galaxeae]|uniref:T9SS type A sorting domain-containing protein n=1 Tax=Aureisphaera galaxeae TaxID=1538023 RepID=UPI002350F602|nr:T9SS type A sorting domain-containing protein [Aureisphaera galaxeae]MDC8003920.1 T9SS type A sorting domain-containing protein [Aureisphaera galaxeae]